MSKQLGAIDSRLESYRLVLQQEFVETYFVGKSSDTVIRGNYTWVAGTNPNFTGVDVIFTKCDGTTETLSPIYGGNLSSTGSPIVLGYCPL